MTIKKNSAFEINIWITLCIFAALIIAFTLYVSAEKQIDSTNDSRVYSLSLINELRQSSFDLTRMARLYVSTRNPIYKNYYQDILDIRDGKKQRPAPYPPTYWDLVIAGKKTSQFDTQEAIPLLKLMKKAGFSEQEIQTLNQAKVNSDLLTQTEFVAINKTENSTTDTQRDAAIRLLFDDHYNQMTANIMEPLNGLYMEIDQRTQNAVIDASNTAFHLRLIFISLSIGLTIMIWRINTLLRTTLGGTVDEIYMHINRLGRGDFSAELNIANNQKNSVLGWLAEMQRNLFNMKQARLKAENALIESDNRYRTLAEFSSAGIWHIDTAGNTIFVNHSMCDMLEIDNTTQLEGKTFHSFFTQDSLEKINTEHKRRAKGIASAYEVQLIGAKGRIRHVLISGAPLTDNNGIVSGIIGTLQDITEHKSAEETLREKEWLLSESQRIAHIGTWSVDIQKNSLYWSEETYRIHGVSPDQFTPTIENLLALTHPENQEELQIWIKALHKNENPPPLTFKAICPDGSIKVLRSQCSLQMNTNNQAIRLVGTVQDITQLHKADERFRNSFKLIPNPLTLQNINGALIDCSDAFCELSGYSRSEVLNQGIENLSLWVEPEKRKVLWKKLKKNKKVDDFEFRLRRRTGEIRDLLISIRYLPNDPEPFVLAVARDITERKTNELALHESALHTQAILDNMFDGVVTIDSRGHIESFNKAASTIFGYTPEEVIGHNASILMPASSSSHHGNYFIHNKALNESRVLDNLREVMGQHKNGHQFPMSLSISKIARKGKATFIGLVRDISQQRKDEEEIYRLAFYDPLTNLPNRRLLFDRLKQAMITSSRTDQHGALMFLDLDFFKQLNDTLGHDLGDVLLQKVATRLQACVRERDSVARMGGDEFVMLIEELSVYPNEAASQAENIANKVLSSLSQPYTLREHTYLITPSIGIVMFWHQTESMDELLKKADVAMYQAKAAGRNNARFFDPTMQAAASVRAELEKSMRKAFELNEFLLHYQLQVDKTGTPIGVEALVRWKHSEHGMISPAAFIPLAEETGMILPLGQWVLETACYQLVEWEKNPQTVQWSMAVNVSISQFIQSDFVVSVKKALEKTQANPHKLKLELTESMLAKDIDDVIHKMNALKVLGVTFSLDDFGTGYSSLSYLKRLPLDQLKIDQSFVRDLLTDPNDAVIAQTIVALGHNLSLTVIAEGVETQEQRQVLANMGCDSYQGYYFARPVSASDLPKTIEKIPLRE